LGFGVEFLATLNEAVINDSRISFCFMDFEEVVNHEDSSIKWRSSVAEPPYGILELVVS
jgi:hypothetical protein